MNEGAKGKYLCCFYQGQQQRQSAVAQFLRDGLAKNHRLLLLAAPRSLQQIQSRLKDQDPELRDALESKQISFATPEDLSLHPGRFDPDQALGALEDGADQAADQGYSGLHAVLDMQPPLAGTDALLLLRFVAGLGEKTQHKPIEALQLYNKEQFDPTLLLEILAAHPLVTDGQEVYENLFHIPQALQAGPQASAVVLEGLLEALTKRKHVEQALRENEQHFRSLVEAAGSPIFVIDSQYKVRQFNQAAESLHGTVRSENMGQDYCRLLFEDYREPFRQAASRVMRGEAVKGLEVELPDAFADRRRVVWNLTGLKDWQGRTTAVIGVGQDITDQQRTSENIAQAQKLETIGQLAGGIAHHFNNLLTIIMGNAELMQRSLPGDSDCQHLAQQVIQAAQRAGDLTTQLLAFARKGRFKLERVELNELLRRTVKLLTVTIDKRVEMHLNLSEEPCCTRGDSSQLENVFLNLCLNARDAMPQGGLVELSTEITSVDHPTARRLDIDPGGYVCVTVCDTGVGMDDETRSRIFEPFFTTKEVGKGAGLGLASVYGCVRNHGGGVEVHTEEGEGTTFHVYLPVAREETSQPATASEPRGSGTILLVDDEESVRAFVAKVLRSFGYKVISCANGQEAVETFSQSPDRYDLVILDMVMPKLDGLDTFRRMKKIKPDLRAMLSSGFSIGDLPGEILEEGVLDFLAKPYRIDQLSQKVQRAIRK